MKTDADSTLDVFRSSTRPRRMRLKHSGCQTDKRKLAGSAVTKDWTQISLGDVKCFLHLLEDPVIKCFHMHDVCCMSSDQYLIAVVFVFFKKAMLTHQEFTRDNFFKALYLAHDIQEEEEELRWEILPWALGKDWPSKIHDFAQGKLELWRKMDFRGIVANRSCVKILTLEAFENHSAFARVRASDHGETRRNQRRTTYKPHGPVWHSYEGRSWLLREKSQMAKGDPTMQNCMKCHGSDPKARSIMAKSWLMSDEIRTMFLQAANILDPDWMIISYGGEGDRSRNLSTIETGLDIGYDDWKSQEIFRGEVDGIISRLAQMTPSPSNCSWDEDENLFPEESFKRKPSEDEVEQFIDCQQFKRGKFEASLAPANIHSMLWGDQS